jgi:hypothetical protein
VSKPYNEKIDLKRNGYLTQITNIINIIKVWENRLPGRKLKRV